MYTDQGCEIEKGSQTMLEAAQPRSQLELLPQEDPNKKKKKKKKAI